MRAAFAALAAIAVAGAAFFAVAPNRATGAKEGKAGAMQIGNPSVGTKPGNVGHGTQLTPAKGNELAVFAQGCFWGVEERLRKVPGVVATAVGYTGGHTENPTYEEVCDHGSGHAEAVLVEFDPKKVSYDQLLQFFWTTHDPTSGDRQGPDVGDQYRSAIFTFGAEQQQRAIAARDAYQQQLQDRITTQIAPAGRFWIAEDYHQQWDEKHGALSCPMPHRPRMKGAAAAAAH